MSGPDDTPRCGVCGEPSRQAVCRRCAGRRELLQQLLRERYGAALAGAL